MTVAIKPQTFAAPLSQLSVGSKFEHHDGFVGSKAVENKINVAIKLGEAKFQSSALAAKVKIPEITSLLDPKTGEAQAYMVSFGFEDGDATRIANQIDCMNYHDANGTITESTVYINGELEK